MFTPLLPNPVAILSPHIVLFTMLEAYAKLWKNVPSNVM